MGFLNEPPGSGCPPDMNHQRHRADHPESGSGAEVRAVREPAWGDFGEPPGNAPEPDRSRFARSLDAGAGRKATALTGLLMVVRRTKVKRSRAVPRNAPRARAGN